MEKWKDECDRKFSNFWLGWVTPIQGRKEITDFIEKVRQEAIMEVIDEIPGIDGNYGGNFSINDLYEIKQHLKSKFL